MRVTAPEGIEPVDLPLEEQVEVVRMQLFSTDARSLQVQQWPLAVGIDASTWVSVVLVVVVHQINTWVVGTRFTVAVDPIELDPEDPKQVFAAPSVASVLVDSSTQAGVALIASLTPPWGTLLRVVARPSQALAEAVSAQTCTLSIRLIGRREGLVGAPHLLLRRANER